MVTELTLESKDPLSSSEFLQQTCKKNPYPSSGAIPSFGHNSSLGTKTGTLEESSSKILARKPHTKFPADKFFFILDLEG
jgi:hypothetical protein